LPPEEVPRPCPRCKGECVLVITNDDDAEIECPCLVCEGTGVVTR